MRHRLPPGIRRLLRIGSIRAQVRRDLDDELAFHFDEAVRELVARGLTEEEARAKALQDFGDEKAYRAALERIGRGRARRQRLALRLDSARWSLRALGRSAVRHP
ncbi:MAG: hypothetical protein GWN71_35760, partial [Gammaproteobacteria bacterium]|nr:hypothetical protein [Gemmatimonadota bacterium]NIU78719.1 hypothetical protein [Gammaproteobacteria bacterium]NIX38083.1 hypothetical protein [Gemmatimonadota bacterium]